MLREELDKFCNEMKKNLEERRRKEGRGRRRRKEGRGKKRKKKRRRSDGLNLRDLCSRRPQMARALPGTESSSSP